MAKYDVKDILKALYFTKDIKELIEILKSPDAMTKYVEKICKEDFSKILAEYDTQIISPEHFKFETNIENKDLPSYVPAIAYKGDLKYLGIGKIDLFMENETFVKYFRKHSDALNEFTYAWITPQPMFEFLIPDLSVMEVVHQDGKPVLQVIGRRQTLLYLCAKISNQCLATEGAEDFVEVCNNLITGTSLKPSVYVKFAIAGETGCKCNKLIKSHSWTLADRITDFTKDLYFKIKKGEEK